MPFYDTFSGEDLVLDWLKESGATYSDREGNIRRVGDGGIDDPTRT